MELHRLHLTFSICCLFVNSKLQTKQVSPKSIKMSVASANSVFCRRVDDGKLLSAGLYFYPFEKYLDPYLSSVFSPFEILEVLLDKNCCKYYEIVSGGLLLWMLLRQERCSNSANS